MQKQLIYLSFFPFCSDLSFKKGDIITLTHEIDDNWYEGCLGNKRGSIPKNFIEVWFFSNFL